MAVATTVAAARVGVVAAVAAVVQAVLALVVPVVVLLLPIHLPVAMAVAVREPLPTPSLVMQHMLWKLGRRVGRT